MRHCKEQMCSRLGTCFQHGGLSSTEAHVDQVRVLGYREGREALMHAVLQDTESEWGTPRSTMTLPDFPVLSGSVSPIPELEALEALSTDAAPVRTHLPEGRRRVFIPDMPVTPGAERRYVYIPSPTSH